MEPPCVALLLGDQLRDLADVVQEGLIARVALDRLEARLFRRGREVADHLAGAARPPVRDRRADGDRAHGAANDGARQGRPVHVLRFGHLLRFRKVDPVLERGLAIVALHRGVVDPEFAGRSLLELLPLRCGAVGRVRECRDREQPANRESHGPPLGIDATWRIIETMTHRNIGRVVRAPHGSTLTCRTWLTEAPFRMIQNNLDPDVAENPAELVVYSGIGKAARDWECFHAILETLKTLGDDESLLVQSGKPVAVFKTHADAPRVLIANSNLVPRWATWDHFNELDRKGLMMYGQMTAGSWIYIGSQGIVQGTHTTFPAAVRP